MKRELRKASLGEKQVPERGRVPGTSSYFTVAGLGDWQEVSR